MNCVRCDTPCIPEDMISCSAVGCKNLFDFQCGGLAETTFRKMGKKKETWKCFDCRAKKDGIITEDGKQEKEGREDEEGMKEYFDKKFELLEKSISDQKDEVIRALNLKVTELEKKLAERDEKIEELENRVDMMENRSRISNLEIRNMPETKNEDVKYLVETIGKTIGITDIREGDIQVAHRVSSWDANKGKRPIVVHLGSRYLRMKWIQQYKEYKKRAVNLTARAINGNLPEVNVYIHEHVTVKTKMLLNEVRAFAKEKNIKFVWIKDGLILIKKHENEHQVVKISSKKEFESFKSKINENF